MVVIPQRPSSLHFADCQQRSSRQKRKSRRSVNSSSHFSLTREGIATSTERRRCLWEGFFFKFFYRDCFHRRSRDSGKWRGIASNVFHNDPRSASGSGKVGFLFARRFLKFILREGSVFKEFLILRIFFVFVTEFGRNGKWLVEKFFFFKFVASKEIGNALHNTRWKFVIC